MLQLVHPKGTTFREVSRRIYCEVPVRIVKTTRTYESSIDDVWDCLTNAERISKWFLPVSGDLRLGGRYQLEGNASGTITECEPPHRFSVTWEYGGAVSWVLVSLKEVSDGFTRFELEHLTAADDAIWEKFGPGATGVGWDLAFLGLARHLETNQPVDRSETQAWIMSEAGKAFISECSDDWCRASIADGTEEQPAEEAARQTTAFYTGERSAER
jgi:uncharacterized protein YndB with AHSA1/START domain